MSNSTPSRNPSAEIRGILRREVNFGCPIRYAAEGGCGSPVLTYHHFDPPWAGNYTHDPGGMIALCAPHHAHADAGAWTVNQLREFKKHPFVDDRLHVRCPWGPEKALMKVGPCLVVGSGAPIRLDGNEVMGFDPVEIEGLDIRTVEFNSIIQDHKGRPWIRIERSSMDIELRGIKDVILTPGGKLFEVRDKGKTWVLVRFKKIRAEQFQEWFSRFVRVTKQQKKDGHAEALVKSGWETVQRLGLIDTEGALPVFSLEGLFQTPRVSTLIQGNRMITEIHIPGLKETVRWHSSITDREHRRLLKYEGHEFFSVG